MHEKSLNEPVLPPQGDSNHLPKVERDFSPKIPLSSLNQTQSDSFERIENMSRVARKNFDHFDV